MATVEQVLFERVKQGRWHTKQLSELRWPEEVTDTTTFLAQCTGVFWTSPLNKGEHLFDPDAPPAVQAFFRCMMGERYYRGSWCAADVFAYERLPLALGFYLLNVLDNTSEHARAYVARLTPSERATFTRLAALTHAPDSFI